MRLLLLVAATAATAAVASAQQQRPQTQEEYQRALADYHRRFGTAANSQLLSDQQQPGYNQQTAPALSRNEVRDEANQYSFTYETADGQRFSESGALKATPDGLDHVLVKQGSYSYYPPGSQTPVQITYSADEGGFHPQGNVLPQEPAPQAF